MEQGRKKGRIRAIISWLIGLVIFIFVIANVICGFMDFTKIQDGEKAMFATNDNTYTYENGTVVEHSFLAYKIYEYNEATKRSIQLMPWFIEHKKLD